MLTILGIFFLILGAAYGAEFDGPFRGGRD